MADKIRRIDYYYATVPDKPGEAAQRPDCTVQGRDQPARRLGFPTWRAQIPIGSHDEASEEYCALACRQSRSPLVILADDWTIYWPISSAMPATGQNSRLMKFAGQKVIASGKVFARSGSRAMVIEKVEAAPPSK